MATTVQHPRIDPAWQVVDLADGSIVFHHASGRTVRLVEPGPDLRRLIALLGRCLDLEAICASFERPLSRAERAGLQEALASLRAHGVVTDAVRHDARPTWLDDALHERFRLQIEDLGRRAGAPRAAWELFGKLRRGHVLVLGAGGAGASVAMLLAAAGVGRLTIVDGDVLETSNLVRQVFYDAADVGTSKVVALRRRVEAFSPFTNVRAIDRFVKGPADLDELVDAEQVDCVAVCANSPPIVIYRWINAVCVRRRIPFVTAFEGQIGPSWVPGAGPCFACFERWSTRAAAAYWDDLVTALQSAPTPQQPSSAGGPWLSALVQAHECLAVVTCGWPLLSAGRAVRVDLTGASTTEAVPVDPSCAVCREAA